MASSKRRRRVVVTAMGCLNAFGYGIERTWSALRQGHSAIAPITRFDVTDFRTKVAAEISEEQMLLLPLEHEVVHLSRNAQFSVAAAAELIHAQHWDHEWPRSAIGICLGSGLGGMYVSEEALAALQRTGPRGVSPLYHRQAKEEQSSGTAAGWMAFRVCSTSISPKD